MGGFPRSRLHNNIRHWHGNWYHCPSSVPFGRDFYYNIVTGRSVWNPYDLNAVNRALPNDEPVPVPPPPLEENPNQVCFGNCAYFFLPCLWCQVPSPKIEEYGNRKPAAESPSASVPTEQSQNTEGRTEETPGGWQDTNDQQNYLHMYPQNYQENYPRDPQNYQQLDQLNDLHNYPQNYPESRSKSRPREIILFLSPKDNVEKTPVFNLFNTHHQHTSHSDLQNEQLNDPQSDLQYYLQSSYQPDGNISPCCCAYCNSAQNNLELRRTTNREVVDYLVNVYIDVRGGGRVPRVNQILNESLSVFNAQANGPVKLILIPRSALFARHLNEPPTHRQDGCSHTLTRVDPKIVNNIVTRLVHVDDPNIINRSAYGSQRPLIKMQSRLNKPIVRKTVALDASVSVIQKPPTSVTCSALEDKIYFGVNSCGASAMEDIPKYSYSFTQLDVTPLKEIASGCDKPNIWYIVIGINTLMNMFQSSEVDADSDVGPYQTIPERIITKIQECTIQSDNVDTRRGHSLIAHKMNIGYAFTAKEPYRIDSNDVVVVLTTYLEMPSNHGKVIPITSKLTTEPSCTTDRTSQASTDVDPSDTYRRRGAIPKESKPKKQKKKKSSKMTGRHFDTVSGQTMTDEYKETERYAHQVPSHQVVDTDTLKVTIQNSDAKESKPRRVVKIVTKSNSVEQSKEYVEAPEDSDDASIETRTIIKVMKETRAILIEEALTRWNISKQETDQEEAKLLANTIVTRADEAAEDYAKAVISEASNFKRMTTTQLEDLKGAASHIQSNNMNGQTEKVNPGSDIKVIFLARYILIATMMIDGVADKMEEAGIIKPKTAEAEPSTTDESSDWQSYCQVLCDEWIICFINLCRYIHNPSDDFAQARFSSTFTEDTGIIVHEVTTLHESLRLFGIKFKNPIIKYALRKLSNIIIACMDRKDKLKETPPRMYYVYLCGYCVFIMEMLMIIEGSKKDIDLVDNYLTKRTSAAPSALLGYNSPLLNISPPLMNAIAPCLQLVVYRDVAVLEISAGLTDEQSDDLIQETEKMYLNLIQLSDEINSAVAKTSETMHFDTKDEIKLAYCSNMTEYWHMAVYCRRHLVNYGTAA